MKKCTKCKLKKYYRDFQMDSSRASGFNAMCRDCVSTRDKKTYALSPEKKQQYYLKATYDMKVSDWQELYIKQKGLCASCGEPPTPRGLAVDHDHNTKKVRALLCIKCNAALGGLGDSPVKVAKLLQYILSFQESD